MAFAARRNPGSRKSLHVGDTPGDDERRFRDKKIKRLKGREAEPEPEPAEKVRKKRKGLAVETGSDGKARIVGQVLDVAIDNVRENAWNPNRMSDRMLETLRTNLRVHGFSDPVTVRSGDARGRFKDGHYEVIDGAHRVRAARLEGMPQVRVNDLGNVPDDKAKTLTINFNDLRGEHDRDLLAALVTELAASDPEGALVSTLPYTEDEIDAFKTIGESDMRLLDSLPEAPVSTGGGEAEDDADGGDEGGESVIDFLALRDLSPKMEDRILARLEAVAQHVKHTGKPGSLLLGIIKAAIKGLDLEVVGKED